MLEAIIMLYLFLYVSFELCISIGPTGLISHVMVSALGLLYMVVASLSAPHLLFEVLH
jgi:hypothetical protein